MKGIVFSQFIEFVESAFTLEIADDIIMSSDLPSGGAYTSVGTYDHKEIVMLVKALSEKTDIPVPDLIRTFGQHLFGVLIGAYPHFLEGVGSSFDFLAGIEDYIHPEVRKLYPDAELPSFSYNAPSENVLQMTYHSTRPFGDLAHGLIEGCATHFGETLVIEKESLSKDGDHSVRFTLTRQV